MSKRSKEMALKAYPEETRFIRDYNQLAKRQIYQEGYEQAEKDLALTWEDIKLICSLYEQIVPMTEWDVIENEKNYPTDESFYSEILKRFNEQRNNDD